MPKLSGKLTVPTGVRPLIRELIAGTFRSTPDANGNYSFPNLPAGTYTLQAKPLFPLERIEPPQITIETADVVQDFIITSTPPDRRADAWTYTRSSQPLYDPRLGAHHPGGFFDSAKISVVGLDVSSFHPRSGVARDYRDPILGVRSTAGGNPHDFRPRSLWMPSPCVGAPRDIVVNNSTFQATYPFDVFRGVSPVLAFTNFYTPPLAPPAPAQTPAPQLPTSRDQELFLLNLPQDPGLMDTSLAWIFEGDTVVGNPGVPTPAIQQANSVAPLNTLPGGGFNFSTDCWPYRRLWKDYGSFYWELPTDEIGVNSVWYLRTWKQIQLSPYLKRGKTRNFSWGVNPEGAPVFKTEDNRLCTIRTTTEALIAQYQPDESNRNVPPVYWPENGEYSHWGYYTNSRTSTTQDGTPIAGALGSPSTTIYGPRAAIRPVLVYGGWPYLKLRGALHPGPWTETVPDTISLEGRPYPFLFEPGPLVTNPQRFDLTSATPHVIITESNPDIPKIEFDLRRVTAQEVRQYVRNVYAGLAGPTLIPIIVLSGTALSGSYVVQCGTQYDEGDAMVDPDGVFRNFTYGLWIRADRTIATTDFALSESGELQYQPIARHPDEYYQPLDPSLDPFAARRGVAPKFSDPYTLYYSQRGQLYTMNGNSQSLQLVGDYQYRLVGRTITAYFSNQDKIQVSL